MWIHKAELAFDLKLRNPTWLKFHFIQAILYNAATDQHIGFRKANFQAIVLRTLLPFFVPRHQQKADKHFIASHYSMKSFI